MNYIKVAAKFDQNGISTLNRVVGSSKLMSLAIKNEKISP
jgi:hypothetical protein